jgi:multidrug resistance efflux pump
LTAQEGQYVQQGESIDKIADCRDRWVDAVVDEGAVQSLQVGLPAEVLLYGVVADAPKVMGKIAMIRSGIGRGALGEDITSPASPNAARFSQIRIVLDPSQATPTAAGNLCYLGYTGRVTFQTPPKPNPVTKLLHQLPMFNRISSNFR